MDWLKAVDGGIALANVYKDVLGDWYRDPWSWAELKWVVQEAPELLAARLNDKGSRRAILIDVPKENFVIRPAILLDPLDRLCYQALVDRLSGPLIGKLQAWAYGWRLARTNPASGVYSRNSSEWSRYRLRLRTLAAFHQYGLETDITSFFATVDINRLFENIRGRLGNNDVVRRLEDFLQSLQAIPGRSGIPQRCWASSVLAHYCLLPIDEFLEKKLPSSTFLGTTYTPMVRWMDDLWLFANDLMSLRLVQIRLQESLRRNGLTMNTAKTRLYEGHEVLEHAREIEHSGVDAALEADKPDVGPLAELVKTLLEHPETASRTSLRFVTTRIRKQKAYDLVPQIVDVVLRLPHASDHVARMLRDSGAWRDLVDWYIDNSRRYNHSLTWSLYHLGTMFPSDERVPDKLKDYWIENFVNGDLPQLHTPMVAQRVAAWDPDGARAAIHESSRQQAYQHPFVMRALGLAGLAAGAPVGETKQLLAQFGETDLTLKFLDSRGMKAPKAAPDFAGP